MCRFRWPLPSLPFTLNYSSRLKARAAPVTQPDCEERTLLRYELLIGAIERHMSQGLGAPTPDDPAGRTMEEITRPLAAVASGQRLRPPEWKLAVLDAIYVLAWQKRPTTCTAEC